MITGAVTDGTCRRAWPLGLVMALYNLLLPLGFLIMLPGSLRKMRRRGGSARDLTERLGFYRPEVRRRLARMHRPVWMHAVSVGEVLVALKLVAAWRRMAPETEFVLSTTTSTGAAVARENAPDCLEVIFNPVDFRGAVRRALELIRPSRIVLVEAEVWPNLVQLARGEGLPVSLVNARLSPRSERRYRNFFPIVAPIFGQLDLACVPEPADRDRWAAIGVRPGVVTVTGAVKHDYAAAAGAEDLRRGEFQQCLQRLFGTADPVLVLAASTHPGEERAVADAFAQIRERHHSARLAVAPRHFERGPEVAAALAAAGFVVRRRSESACWPEEGISDPVFLIDTTGELRLWQSLATVVVIGKSFLAEGGQNPVEALMAGRPVICGPHMENFGPLMQALLGCRGIRQVRGLDELPDALSGFLGDPAEARALARRAQAALEPHQGAAARTVAAVLR